MSGCTHPTSALFVDRQQGKTICTLCGDVVMNDQFELDPVFAQGGGKPSGGGGAGGLRTMAGSFRPAAAYKGGNTSMAHSHSRPTIDKARREMLNISRALEISDDTVERALGIYKVALSVNAVSGTRPSVLCGCLYAACRRERTSHVVHDFAEKCDEDPHAILTQLKIICHATHTEVPVVDPSCYVQRFAELMNLKEKTADVIVCALKVLRAMQDDWVSCGRRPMGVCAAALLVACYMFGISRTPEEVCGMVRLTANTISKRLNEFAATPTAALESIDDYRPSQQTLPPAFNDSSRKSTEEDVHASMRELSAIFYELVAEAKTSQPATPERCDKWRRFILKHCELEEITPLEENLDLAGLTPEQQLHILGLPHAKPISAADVERSVKEEEHRLLVKREESTQRSQDGDPSHGMLSGPGFIHTGGGAAGWSGLPDNGLDLPPSVAPSPYPLDLPADTLSASLAAAAVTASPFDDVSAFDEPSAYDAPAALRSTRTAGAPSSATADSPEQMQWLTSEYTRLLNTNAEVLDLRNDFDFMDDDGSGKNRAADLPTQNNMTANSPSARGSSPPPGTPGDSEAKLAFHREDENVRAALEDLLYDRERRHALPWEFLVLPPVDEDDCTDFLPYLVLDNEERVRRERVGLELYREKWVRGRARTEEEINRLEEMRLLKRRRRDLIAEPATNVPSAIERALRGRGARTVNVSQIDELLPGMLEGGEEEANAEWD